MDDVRPGGKGRRVKGMAGRVRAVRKHRFLRRYLAEGTFCRAAEYAGVTAAGVRLWLKKDARFAEAFASVKAAYCERLEQEADRRAMHGEERMRFYQGVPLKDPRTGKLYLEREFSDALLMFRLRALKPEVYREGRGEVREEMGMKLYRGVDVERV